MPETTHTRRRRMRGFADLKREKTIDELEMAAELGFGPARCVRCARYRGNSITTLRSIAQTSPPMES
jgi:hypothetical protein